MELIFLLVFFPVAHSVKHSLKYFLTESSGLQTFPEFVAVSIVDGVRVGYCDSNNKKAEPRQAWVRELIEDSPELMQWHIQACIDAHQDLKALREDLKLHFNQTGGVHIFQEMSGCEWDDETGKVSGYQEFGYDGEDFVSLDLKTQTWVYTKHSTSFIEGWERDKARLEYNSNVLINIYPKWLKKFVNYGRSSLLRTDRPSVSLLQKTPSSPVSCHATGFYPDRAMMFWRKDGEELDEDVDRGEILPNHDGTFQMRADLNISSVSPEDWRRYDCVFQLSGVKEDIITKLDQAEIRTNRVPPSEFPAAAVIGVVVGLLLLLLCISGLFIWRRNNNGFRPANTSDSSPPDAFLSQ
ncbi:major histocompatibility complex class I-related gene protein isoform X5 [Lates calcarifer]|uniref:Major histocompatibility complex class I-related gene protein isoform X5 n=1 Tax=Lates calcarifer TaxID=8187 RepID=A0AAJ7QL19_LATCA|nr:major histocompatibility complex class I-related gene protein isoform X5 [Lates calcarifer]